MMNYAWDLANKKCFEWIIIMIIMIISFFQSHSIWFAKKEKVSSNKLYKNMGCDFFQLDYNHDIYNTSARYFLYSSFLSCRNFCWCFS